MRKGKGAGGVRKTARKQPKTAKKPKPTSSVEYRVRELDPQSKCGLGTTVERLFRVDERLDGLIRPHLVFLDHHGWYCEHGRACPAVDQARKSIVKARHTGPTHNGRMRA